MNGRKKALVYGISLVVISAALVGIATAAVPRFKDYFKGPGATPIEPSVRLAVGKKNTFEVLDDVAKRLGLDKPDATAEVRPSRPLALEMAGTLALDSNHLVSIHSRFPGEVVEIGRAGGKHISFGDTVQGPRYKDGKLISPGTLLAVVWSKDLGEKKSEFVDALSQFRVDSETLTRLLKYSDVIPERSVREQEAKVALDRNAIFKAERTLRVWRLTNEEIDEIRNEAEQIYQSSRQAFENPKEIKLNFGMQREKDWGKVEIRAPFDGTVMEKNVAVGSIVDTSADMYKVADLRHLSIWANAYEEDVPRLLRAQQGLVDQALRDKKAPPRLGWNIRFLGADDKQALEPGYISQIGKIIDPQQHTALVMGQVENPNGYLRSGQFVTAIVELPANPTEVEVPTAALIENGSESTVLVQPDPARFKYELRRVAVSRRSADRACIRNKLSADEEKRGIAPLRAGERVVTVAGLELTAVYKELRDSPNNAAE